jgi:hypothetical protein
MVAPPSDDPRRTKEFPDELVQCLVTMTEKGIRPRDIVTPASLRNALTVTIAMGGSTNVALHSVERSVATVVGMELQSSPHALKQDHLAGEQVHGRTRYVRVPGRELAEFVGVGTEDRKARLDLLGLRGREARR